MDGDSSAIWGIYNITCVAWPSRGGEGRGGGMVMAISCTLCVGRNQLRGDH